MQILVRLASPGGRLSRPFQIFLNSCIEAAADELQRRPLPSLYYICDRQIHTGTCCCAHIEYQTEPWAGEGVEEFADPYTVFERGWGDCDDLVIFRGAQIRSVGYPCHARILHDPVTNKYHTQLTRDFDRVVEDPALQRLQTKNSFELQRSRKPWHFPLR